MNAEETVVWVLFKNKCFESYFIYFIKEENAFCICAQYLYILLTILLKWQLLHWFYNLQGITVYNYILWK